MDALNSRVNTSINSVIETTERVLRPHVAAAYRCAAACYEDPTRRAVDVAKCSQACQEKPNAYQQAFTTEMKAFQDRIARCEADAHDKLESQFGRDKNVDQAAAERKFVELLTPCVEDHLSRLPSIVERMRGLAGDAPVAAAPAPAAAKSGWFK